MLLLGGRWEIIYFDHYLCCLYSEHPFDRVQKTITNNFSQISKHRYTPRHAFY